MSIPKLFLILALAIFAPCFQTKAVNIFYGASQSNGFGDSAGNGLVNVRMELGTYTPGNASSFSLLSVGTLNGFGAGLGGVGSSQSSGNIAVAANLRLAIRVYNTSDNSGSIVHFVSSSIQSWQTIGGDGSATDTNSQTIDLADLTNASNDTVLSSAVIVVGGSPPLKGTSGLGAANFAAAPEPSSIMLLGGGAMLLFGRRRRA